MKSTFAALFAFAILSAATINAHAQEKSVRGILGFNGGALDIGADFEMKQTNLYGFGGYFYYASDDDDSATDQVIALGAFLPIHLLNDNQIDVYVAPGFGLAMIEEPGANGDDATTLGASLKLGAEYRLSPTVKAGLQHAIISNWFSDKVETQFQYTNAAVTVAF